MTLKERQTTTAAALAQLYLKHEEAQKARVQAEQMIRQVEAQILDKTGELRAYDTLMAEAEPVKAEA